MRTRLGAGHRPPARATWLSVVYAVSAAVAFALGLVVGRWWAVLAGVAFGVWVGLTSGVEEVPAWFLGVAYGAVTVASAGLGVVTRRVLQRGP